LWFWLSNGLRCTSSNIFLALVAFLKSATCFGRSKARCSDREASRFWLAGLEFNLGLGDWLGFAGNDLFSLMTFLEGASGLGGTEAWCTDGEALRLGDRGWFAGDECFDISLVTFLQGATSFGGTEARCTDGETLRSWERCSKNGGENGEEGGGDCEAG
jgi:hypothetical protein